MEHAYYIGMDLRQRTSTLVVKDKDGRVFDEQKIATTPEAVSAYVKQFTGAALAVEPVSQWYYYADLLESLGVEVHIAHPRRVKAIASARIKTDSIDAGVLCDLLRGNLLPESYRAPKEVKDARLLATIPGFSYLSALTVMAEIGTIDRFPSAKKLMGYAGLQREPPFGRLKSRMCPCGHAAR